jgi:hypothetical protein
MRVSPLAYSSTLKIEAKCSSGTSVDFQQPTRRYIPKDRSQIFQLVNNGTSSLVCSHICIPKYANKYATPQVIVFVMLQELVMFRVNRWA